MILNQVENELQETTHSATNTLVLYMEQLKEAFWAAGITVPLTHNEKGERSTVPLVNLSTRAILTFIRHVLEHRLPRRWWSYQHVRS